MSDVPGPTITVTVTQTGTDPDGKPICTIAVSPLELTLPTSPQNVRLTFNLVQAGGASGWRFPLWKDSAPDADYYYGLTIFCNDANEFIMPNRVSDTQVAVTDANNTDKQYDYSVIVENPTTQQTLCEDPHIKNGGP